MTSAPSLSVVISLFNKGNCIERALRSVLKQTVPCHEIILVDDGSTDGGAGIVARVQDRRIRLFRQQNQGPSAARNRGITEAGGDLVAFLDADDEWKPWFLETIRDLWNRYRDVGVYATAYEIQDPYGHAYIPSFTEIPPPPWEGIIPNFFRSAAGSRPLWTSAVVVPREVFDTAGRFVPCSGVGEDADLWGRIALRYPIAFSRRVGAVYHREAENRYCETVFSHVFTTDSFERAMQGRGVPPHILRDAEEFLAHERLVAASRYVLGGQPQMARSVLRNCRTRRFLLRKSWWWLWSWLPSAWVRLAWRGKRWLRRYVGP